MKRKHAEESSSSSSSSSSTTTTEQPAELWKPTEQGSAPKAPRKPASLYQNWKQHARKNHTALKQLKGKEFTTAAKATFSALAPSDPSHVLAAQKFKDDTVIYTSKLKEYTTALKVWEARGDVELVANLAVAVPGTGVMKALLDYCSTNARYDPYGAASAACKIAIASAKFNEQEHAASSKAAAEAEAEKTANARAVKRIRGMSETELLSFVQEVNGLRTRLANIDAAKVAAEEKEERRLVEEAAMLERRIQEKAKNVPKDAKQFKKSIRQDLKKQLKYSPAMRGGRPGTLSCTEYNVSQDVWDCMFPEAKGRSAVNISDPSDTFDASFSYFTKSMRYGGSLEVTSMSASLYSGLLRVNGQYGISKY